jgi:hypothetical protein
MQEARQHPTDRRSYRQWHESELHPAGGACNILDISGYFALAPNASLPSVVLLGDDVTSQWTTNSTAFDQNPNWINKGVAGQTSRQVLARFQTDVIDLHPAIVNIIVGTNDVATPVECTVRW